MAILVGGFLVFFGVVWILVTAGMGLLTGVPTPALFPAIGGIVLVAGVIVLAIGIVGARRNAAETNKIVTQGGPPGSHVAPSPRLCHARHDSA